MRLTLIDMMMKLSDSLSLRIHRDLQAKPVRFGHKHRPLASTRLADVDVTSACQYRARARTAYSVMTSCWGDLERG